LIIALALIVVFMAGEVVVGVVAQSLALLSDAAHMLTDAGSIVLAIIAIRLAARPPRGGYTYGLKRVEILSAQANGLTLLLLAAWLAYEAIRRLIYGFIATAIAGAIVLSTGFARADAIAALIVVALMVRAGAGLVHQSGRIFLEAAPAGIDTRALGGRLAAHPDVVEVHDLHVWQITSGQPALSAHVLVAPGRDCHAVRTDLQTLLAHDYAITHVTLQLDHPPPDLFTITRTHDADERGHCTDLFGTKRRQ
jgi:cobalt-zinc-cadmium efflux system protein